MPRTIESEPSQFNLSCNNDQDRNAVGRRHKRINKRRHKVITPRIVSRKNMVVKKYSYVKHIYSPEYIVNKETNLRPLYLSNEHEPYQSDS